MLVDIKNMMKTAGVYERLGQPSYFMSTKFHQNTSSGSGEEFENVKSFQTDGRVDGQRKARYDNSTLEPSAYVR